MQTCLKHWTILALRAHQAALGRTSQAEEERTPLPIAQNRAQRYAFTDTGNGDKRFADVLRYLGSFGMQPSVPQRMFLIAFANACLPKIYKDEWEEAHIRVLEERGISRLHTEVFVIASRQVGKTTALSWFLAAMLLGVPGLHIAVFSTGRRASEHIKDATLTNIERVDRLRVCHDSKEHLAVCQYPLPPNATRTGSIAMAASKNETTSHLSAFPANPTGTFKRQAPTAKGHLTDVTPGELALLTCFVTQVRIVCDRVQDTNNEKKRTKRKKKKTQVTQKHGSATKTAPPVALASTSSKSQAESGATKTYSAASFILGAGVTTAASA